MASRKPLGRIKRDRRASYLNGRFPKLWLGPWQELDSAQWMDLAWLGSSGSAAAQCCGLELQVRSNKGVGPDRVYCAGGPSLQLAARDGIFLQWNYLKKKCLCLKDNLPHMTFTNTMEKESKKIKFCCAVRQNCAAAVSCEPDKDDPTGGWPLCLQVLTPTPPAILCSVCAVF